MFRVSAPYRIDLGGGVTDVPEIGKLAGTLVVNLGLDIYLDSSYQQLANVEFLFKESRQKKLELKYNDEPVSLDENREDRYRYLRKCLKKYFSDIQMTLDITSNLPPSTGLGGSSILSTCFFAAREFLDSGEHNPNSVLSKARKYETEDMGIKGGFQDYIGAYFGALNMITFSSLSKSNIEEHRSSLGRSIRKDLVEYLDENMIIVLLKNPRHNSDKIVRDEIRNIENAPQLHLPQLNTIKKANTDIFDLLNSDLSCKEILESVGESMKWSWQAHKSLSSHISGSVLDKIEENILPFSYGLRGPGAAGNSLFIISRSNHRNRIREYLNQFQQEILILSARVNRKGVEIKTAV